MEYINNECLCISRYYHWNKKQLIKKSIKIFRQKKQTLNPLGMVKRAFSQKFHSCENRKICLRIPL